MFRYLRVDVLVTFVNRVLAKRGGDVTIRDVTRFGRAPAGINNKRLKDGSLKYGGSGKYGFSVRLVSTDYSCRHSMEAIASAFGFAIPDPPPPRVYSVDEVAERDDDARWLQVSVIFLSKAKMGEGTRGEVVKNMSGKYRIKCPWGDEHTNGDPYGAYFRGPVPGADHPYVFGCSHDTCRKERKRGWTAFVDKVALPAIVDDLLKATAAEPMAFKLIVAAAAIEREQEEARATYLAGLKARAARAKVAA